MYTEDDELEAFFQMMENTVCSDYIDFMEFIDGLGCYIPFITTVNYLTHSETRKAFKLKDYTKLKN